jgi:hypothetical protein
LPDEASTTNEERCGACGQLAPRDAELCPACGALLAAYRVAETVPAESTIAQVVIEPRVSDPAPEPSRLEPQSPPVDRELAAARTRLLGTLLGPERRLIAVVEAEETALEEPTPAPPPMPPDRLAPGVSVPRPAARPFPPVATDESPPFSSPLRRPGYVSKGPVEPVFLIGAALLVVACVLVACASLVSSDGLVALGYFAAVVGVVSISIGFLVWLAQRDQERD